MIDLRINNQSLDLYPDTSISMEENSSVFSSDVMPGSFSMPFTIPASANNSRLLGFPEMLNLKDKPKLRYAAELIVEGVPYLSGEVIFRGFGDDKYKINFQSQLSLVNQYFQDTKIRDLGHEPVVILDPYSIEPPAAALKYVDVWMDRWKAPETIRLALNGQEFEQPLSGNWRDELAALVEAANIGVRLVITDYVWEDDLNTEVYKFFFSLTAADPDYNVPIEVDFNDNESDPAFYLNYKWSEDYTPLINDAIKALDAFDLSNSDFVLPTVYNPSFYQGEEGSFSGIFNEYVDGKLITMHLNGQRSSFIPMFSLTYVFRKIKEATGVEIIGDFVDHPDVQKLIFFNNFSLDMKENTYPGSPTLTYHYRINPANHLPDWTINELLLELGKAVSLGFDFDPDAMTLELYFRKEVIENFNFVDISDKTNPRFELNFGQNEGFRIAYKWDTKDMAYNPESPGDMAPVVLGSGKNNVELKLYTTNMRDHPLPPMPIAIPPPLPFTRILRMPYVNQPGAWERKEVPSDPRLLFYHGMQKNNVDEDYPYASADNVNYKGQIVGELTLNLAGLYEKTLKPWYEFLMIDQQVDREGYWSIIDLLNHNEKKKYRIDQIRYLIKRISYSVSTRKGLGPVKLEMLKAE